MIKYYAMLSIYVYMCIYIQSLIFFIIIIMWFIIRWIAITDFPGVAPLCCIPNFIRFLKHLPFSFWSSPAPSWPLPFQLGTLNSKKIKPYQIYPLAKHLPRRGVCDQHLIWSDHIRKQVYMSVRLSPFDWKIFTGLQILLLVN